MIRITDVREITQAIASPIRNAYIDFSKMTTSLVAVVTDHYIDGRPVVGYGFNSNGRYGQGGLIRERFAPRLMAAEPASLMNDAGDNIDPHRAWSALMQNEKLAIEIAQAVVAVCAPRGVPVTLKMRTGWCDTEKNALTLAKAFESAGIQMVTVHGRTREQGYKGFAEYDTVAAVKAALKIPVVANGDIDSPDKALQVLKHTGADALMVGRAAQGRPWIFREIVHFLATGEYLAPPLVAEVKRALLEHLQDHYGLYGELTGVRSARKHIGWYVRDLPGGDVFRESMNTLETADLQSRAVADFFEEMAVRMERMPKAVAGNQAEMALETME
jgi:tRNA-dihydrouridine synthase B